MKSRLEQIIDQLDDLNCHEQVILAEHLLDLIRRYEFPATDFPEETSEQFEDSLRRQEEALEAGKLRLHKLEDVMREIDAEDG